MATTLTPSTPPAAGPRQRTPVTELWLYVLAAASYIGCGLFVKQIFAWWWFGAAWFVLFVWLVPIVLERVRGLLRQARRQAT